MKKSSPLLIIFFTIIVDMLGVGILIPIYPLLILPGAFKVIPDGWSIDSGFILLGWLNATFPLMQFFFTPFLGQLADRLGRRRVLLGSILGSGIGYAIFAYAIFTKNIPLLFIARAIDGISGGNIAVAQAVIADISEPQDRAKNFALVGVSFGLGFVLGPFIGGVLSDATTVSWFSAAIPFCFASLLCFINASYVFKFLPETLKVRSERKLDITKPLYNIKMAFSTDGLRNIMPATFLFNWGFTFFTTFFALVLVSKYLYSQTQVGNFFAYTGIMIIFGQFLVIRQVAKYLADYQVLRFSFYGVAICLVSYFFVPVSKSYLLYVVPPFLASFNSMCFSFSTSLVTRVTPVHMRGEALGINSSVVALGQAIPAIMSGYVAMINPIVPTVLGGCIVAIAGVIFWYLFNPSRFSQAK